MEIQGGFQSKKAKVDDDNRKEYHIAYDMAKHKTVWKHGELAGHGCDMKITEVDELWKFSWKMIILNKGNCYKQKYKKSAFLK